MSSFEIDYIHLADAASVDGFGKVNVLGIFDKFILDKVPVKHLKFTIVLKLLFIEVKDTEINLEIKFNDPDSKTLKIKSPIQLKFVIPEEKKGKNGELNLILDVGNLEFTQFGRHKLKILVQGKLLVEKPFLVEERKT